MPLPALAHAPLHKPSSTAGPIQLSAWMSFAHRDLTAPVPWRSPAQAAHQAERRKG